MEGEIGGKAMGGGGGGGYGRHEHESICNALVQSADQYLGFKFQCRKYSLNY